MKIYVVCAISECEYTKVYNRNDSKKDKLIIKWDNLQLIC